MSTAAGGGPDGDGGWRPGAPAERTSLAWIRTSLSILLAAGGATHLALWNERPWAAGLAALGCACGVCSITLWWRRARRTAGRGRIGAPGPLEVTAGGAVVAAVAAVTCLGAAALVLAAFALAG